MPKYVLLFISFLFTQISYAHSCPDDKYNFNQQTNKSSCLIWGNYYVKTFDDYSLCFKSASSFTLASFTIGKNPFQIEVGKKQNCKGPNCNTSTHIIIIYGETTYNIGLDDNEQPVFKINNETHKVPNNLPKISLYKPANRLFIDFTELGISIKWDTKNMIEVTIDNEKGYNVLGLCGNNDKCSSNDKVLQNKLSTDDIMQFLQAWRTNNSGGIEVCNPGSEHDIVIIKIAQNACQVMKDPKKFAEANQVLNPAPFIEACIDGYYSCDKANQAYCFCETLDAYAKSSIIAGAEKVSWRNNDTCSMQCVRDLHYRPCAPEGGVRSCGDSDISQNIDRCEEGCYCPPEKYLSNGKCYLKKRCPCLYKGAYLEPDERVSNDCNTCACKSGKLECTDSPCVVATCCGNHYTTFDGKKYDFQGQCVYYLVKGPDFSIEILNNHEYVKNYTSDSSYAKGVIVRMKNHIIELKPKLVYVNDVKIRRFPRKVGDILITKLCNGDILVSLPNNVQVQWDHYWTITVKLPSSMKGQVKGLLGTYNANVSDDFITPDGSVVNDTAAFGNSWKTEDSCPELSEISPIHPCDLHPEVKKSAEQGCSLIKSPKFENCKNVNAEIDYNNCVYDSCLHHNNTSESYCNSIATFAIACGRLGIAIDWRESLPECKLVCPKGLEYQVCANECRTTCRDISYRPNCAELCTEGCVCPMDEVLDEDGNCIPIEMCKCRLEGAAFPPGYMYLKNEEELVFCEEARWITSEPEGSDNIPKIEDLNEKCSSIRNSCFTPCKETILETCQNMDEYEIRSISNCQEGCQCIEGYVLNSKTNHCVKYEDCPCYYRGKSHNDGIIIEIDNGTKCRCINESWSCDNLSKSTCNERDVKEKGCNKCVCVNGTWTCTEGNCQSTFCMENDVKIVGNKKCVCQRRTWKCARMQCDVWGGSLIKTFDDVHYHYEGPCSYNLLQGKLNETEFNIILINEFCHVFGTTCLKSITINTYIKGLKESLTLVTNANIATSNDKKQILLTDYVAFITIDIIGAGIQVFWDKNTWMYVQLNPTWLNNVRGPCAHTSATSITNQFTFHLSYKPTNFHSYISFGQCQIKNETQHNARKIKWAQTKCNILNSDLFSLCRRIIVADKYYKYCVQETFKCNELDTCPQFCSMVAAYAQQCTDIGVHIKWRRQDLCPFQCTPFTKYQPCAKLCPPTTCEIIRKNVTLNCEAGDCIEGCTPGFVREGYAYSDSTYQKFIPVSECRRTPNPGLHYHFWKIF